MHVKSSLPSSTTSVKSCEKWHGLLALNIYTRTKELIRRNREQGLTASIARNSSRSTPNMALRSRFAAP